MHILILHQIFVTPEQGGGTRHYEIAKYLVKKGYTVTVVASDVDYLSGKKKEKKTEIKDQITIHYVKTVASVHKDIIHRAIAFISFAISAFFKLMSIRNVDIIFSTSPPLFQVFSAYIVSKLKRKPFIFEIRDLWLDFGIELGVIKKGLGYFLLKKLEPFLYRKADILLVNSPGFIPFIQKIVPQKTIYNIPNSVSTSDFEKVPIIRERNKDPFRLIYSGNMGVANDLHTILNAAQQLLEYNDIEFIFLGGGMKKAEYQLYCQQHHITNVVFRDPVPKNKLFEIFSEVDVCIATLKDIPLFRTNYPNKVFDYMAAGKPTILGIEGVIKDVMVKANGGICIQPGNSDQLKAAVLEYYHHPSKIYEHGQNAREYVKRHFERDLIAEKLFAILEKTNT